MSYQEKDKPNSSTGNGDVGHIKDTGTDRSNTHIYKINDFSLIENAVYQISSASGQNERKRDDCWIPNLFRFYEVAQ